MVTVSYPHIEIAADGTARVEGSGEFVDVWRAAPAAITTGALRVGVAEVVADYRDDAGLAGLGGMQRGDGRNAKK